MRKVKITGYIIYDETYFPTGHQNGESVAAYLEAILFNEEFTREWSFSAEYDEEIEWEDEE